MRRAVCVRMKDEIVLSVYPWTSSLPSVCADSSLLTLEHVLYVRKRQTSSVPTNC